eukprot:11568757-Ditylum_brightwellii.AAC.1
MSTVWSKIAHMHKNNQHSSITSIKIPESWQQIGDDISTVTNIENPNKAKVWQLMEILQEIMHYLTFWNRLHFGQTRGTPFTIPPLSIEVDWVANAITSELIVEGPYTNEEIDALTLKLLEHCKKEEDIIELGETISIQEWKEKLKYGMKGQLLLH